MARSRTTVKRAVHFSGGLCCSGDKAEAIQAAGNQTTVPERVTCAACKKRMEKAVAPPEPNDPVCECGHVRDEHSGSGECQVSDCVCGGFDRA